MSLEESKGFMGGTGMAGIRPLVFWDSVFVTLRAGRWEELLRLGGYYFGSGARRVLGKPFAGIPCRGW